MKKHLLHLFCIISLGLTAQLPSIITQPINTTVSVGGNIIYSVIASGTITGYQWQLSTNGGVSFNDISAAGINPSYGGWTTANLTLSGIPSTANGYVYRCQVFGSSASTIESLTTPGAGSWTCPSGVTSVTVQCWGAGGAGGSCPAGTSQNCSGGGGGGAFSSSLITVVPGNAYAYTIGTGGTPSGTNGNPGGTTHFNNNAILAVGGQGGGWRAPDGYNPGGAGASGGSFTSCIGSIKYSGGNGNSGTIGYCGGGGAGGAGTAGNGGNATGGINWTGGSGGANFGGNGGHGGSWPDRGTYTGANGNSIGGGGGGSNNYGWSPNATYGGYGANGAIKISYNASQVVTSIFGLLSVTSTPAIITTASPTLINCGESATLTASSISAAQPCIKVELPATLQSGLVGYWPFCGNANDASGNNNNGTVEGAILTTDRFGNANSAYSFDGTSNHIVAQNSSILNNLNSLTLSYWINIVNFPSASNVVSGTVTKWYQTGSCGSNTDHFGSWLTYDNKIVGGTRLYGALATMPQTNSTMLQGNWYHVVLTHDLASGGSLYINGVLISSLNTAGALCTTTNNLFFGCDNMSGALWRFLNGKLDDIAIYNRVLTTLEIQQLYSLGNVNYSWSTGATTPSITVSPAQTTSYSCSASNSAGSTMSSVTVNVADSLSWTGLVDTDWHKPCNWSPQFVPKCCNNVAIPLTSNQPIVSGVAAAEDLTIYTTNGALLTVNTGANLQIADCPTTITTATCPSLAVLTTTAVSSITLSTAISGGTISYQGASAISARGICWSTSINPTLANSFTTNGTGIGTFISNLTGLIAGTTYYVCAYATNASGTNYGNQVSFTTQTLAAQYPAGSVFCAGPTIIVDVTNPTTGKIWMDRNLGATQVSTSSTDAASYGDLYQWGRRADGHQCRTSATTSTLSSIDQPANGNFILAPSSAPYDWRSPQNVNLWQGVIGVNNPCPSGYRIPTEPELEAERLSWSVNTSVGAFASPLKLPMAGKRHSSSGLIDEVGYGGNYWSSSVSGTNSRSLDFSSSNATMSTYYRSFGRTVRCLKD